MTPMRYKAFRYVFFSVLALRWGIAVAQDYPTRPVRVIVPYAAGGATDIAARALAPKLGEFLGQAVIVENRPGGGTLIGTRAALQAPPDGHTITLQATTLALNSLAYKAPGYKMSDFVPLYPVLASRYLLSVHEAVPAKNLRELVNYAKANPGKLTSISLGESSVSHLILDRFKAAAGIETTSVSYGGSGPANQALIGGVVDLFVDGSTTGFQTAKSGKTRMLAVSGPSRWRMAPDVPTFVELGYPMMASAVSWTAMFASAKTPPAAVQRLRGDLGKTLAAPEVRERLNSLGSEIWPGQPQDFAAFIVEDLALWERDIRRAKLALEE